MGGNIGTGSQLAEPLFTVSSEGAIGTSSPVFASIVPHHPLILGMVKVSRDLL